MVRDVAFMVGERVFLRVSPMKGVMRFRKKGKLSLRFIGPFEILWRMGDVAYELALPLGLSAVHPVFHMSMLRKYHADPSHMLDFNTVQLDKDLTYEKEPMAILDRQWIGQPAEAATWESELICGADNPIFSPNQMARTHACSSVDQQHEPPAAAPPWGIG
ncbi:uncharacterized protein [Nicotiana sylvestris]|uniref:uncharacterized protein n=1 Tax=Nicotiana sylvestris TaxID=4096 RepID=UPI00388C340C